MANVQEDKGINPLLNNHFLLRVDAVYDLPCIRIGSFSSEKEYENIHAGGVNDYVFLREKPISKALNFDVERYIGTNFFDPLPVGKHLELPIILYISRYANDFKEPKWTFSFSGCVVTAKHYGELNAEKSGLMVEKTTIAYQQVKLEQGTDEPKASWSFDMTGRKYQGNGQRKAIIDREELRKKELAERSKVWPKARSARTLGIFQK